MELLVPKLRAYYSVKAVSSKKNKALRILDMVWCIMANRKKCKVVFIDTYSTQAFWYAYLVSRCCNYFSLAYVPILHGGNLPDRFRNDSNRVIKFLRQANKIVSPSLYLQEFFKKNGFDSLFIPNFIDIKNYSYLLRSKIRPKLLWVRAFQEIYNPSLAIYAFQMVLKKYPLAELCMVGAPKDYTFDEVKRLIEEFKISNKIKITGILAKEEWIRLSVEYDIFINTTTIDNMPISIIEAMALGLPVVSTNVGGIPYLIENDKEGILVPSGSAKDMAAAIIGLIEDSENANRLASNARTKAEGFSWDGLKTKWIELVESY